MASDRVTIRANDAIEAFVALRRAIEHNDRVLRKFDENPALPGREDVAQHRGTQWAAYQRIAKALNLKPTLSE